MYINDEVNLCWDLRGKKANISRKKGTDANDKKPEAIVINHKINLLHKPQKVWNNFPYLHKILKLYVIRFEFPKFPPFISWTFEFLYKAYQIAIVFIKVLSHYGHSNAISFQNLFKGIINLFVRFRLPYVCGKQVMDFRC